LQASRNSERKEIKINWDQQRGRIVVKDFGRGMSLQQLENW